MNKKVWVTNQITTSERQIISIYPTENWNDIIVEVIELDDRKEAFRLYLNKDELEVFIQKMQDMINYVKQ